MTHTIGQFHAEEVDSLLSSLSAHVVSESSADELRELLAQTREHLEATRNHNLVLAEAVANSASIIEELEQTKEMLAGAQTEAEQSHKNTLLLSESIFERTQDSMVVLRADGSCTSANQNAIDLLGLDSNALPQENILNQLVTQFDAADGQPWIDEVEEELRETGVARHEFRRKDDENSQWLEFSFNAVSAENTHYLIIGRDITAQKAAEAELRSSRDFLNNTINALPDALCVKSTSLSPVLVNDSFRVIADANQKQNLELANSFCDCESVRNHEQTLLDEGNGSDNEETAVDRMGRTRYFSTRRSVFSDPVTGERFLVAASRDVTEQRLIEERNRSLAGVFENAREGVVLLDLAGNITDVNPEFLRYTGLDLKEIIHRNLSEIADWEGLDFLEIIASANNGEPSLGRVTLDPKVCNLDASNEKIFWGSLSTSGDDSDEATSLIAMFSDITQMEETQKRLHRQALHDNLTGLPNRRYFTERLESMIAATKDPGSRFGVCFLDLDDFKVVNDTLGHDAGDQLLIEVAERIKSVIYRDCFFSRFGGDEFALLIPEEVGSERILTLSNAIVKVLNTPFNLGENNVYIGVSIGMTLCPDDADEVNQLLRHADVAMYHAKDKGKNTVREFTPTLAATIEARQELLNDLRLAVESRDVSLVFQPKLNLKTGMLSGCEALVRWVKNGQVMNPGDFIDVAEKSGLIHPLGDQVLELAMQQTKRWRDQGLFDGTVAINLSPRQLADPGFIDRFQQLMSDTGTQPDWFELEITENAMVENLDNSLKRMEQIRELGSRIAIDDFGTGYSSLNYLKTFPVSTLKIDLSFVRDLPDDAKAVAVARTVLSLGHGLGLEVVAEGVENKEQYRFFKDAGCDVIQGYFINSPLPADEFGRFAIAFSKFASEFANLALEK